MAERKSGVVVETLISLSLICPESPIHWSMINSQPALHVTYMCMRVINKINQYIHMYLYTINRLFH